MPYTLDWERVTRAFLHPLKLQILDALAQDGDGLSPNEMALAFKAKLGDVSYHMGTLEKAGLVECVRTRPVRGAVEHFYRLAGEE